MFGYIFGYKERKRKRAEEKQREEIRERMAKFRERFATVKPTFTTQFYQPLDDKQISAMEPSGFEQVIKNLNYNDTVFKGVENELHIIEKFYNSEAVRLSLSRTVANGCVRIDMAAALNDVPEKERDSMALAGILHGYNFIDYDAYWTVHQAVMTRPGGDYELTKISPIPFNDFHGEMEVMLKSAPLYVGTGIEKIQEEMTRLKEKFPRSAVINRMNDIYKKRGLLK